MLKAKTIEQDCFACPSSWSGQLTDGRNWRARYRWGYLRFVVDPDPNKLSVFSQEPAEICEEFQLGDGLDGFLEYDKMRDALSHLIDLSDAAPVDPDELRMEYDLSKLKPRKNNAQGQEGTESRPAS